MLKEGKRVQMLTVDKRGATGQQKDVVKDCDGESEGRRERQRREWKDRTIEKALVVGEEDNAISGY